MCPIINVISPIGELLSIK